jgi:UPF0042 nucleotide-binding protein
VLFLEAATRELVRRYEATRRKHPFTEANLGLEDLIERERQVLEDVRASADLVIDTTAMTVHQLKAQLLQLFGPEAPGDSLQVSVMSFGFKHGIPIDVDIVFDVRFLPNPHWDEELRPLTGRDEAVSQFVMSNPLTQQFVQKVEDLLELILPAYAAEGRSYLTVAIGCTGGRHRSVAITEALAQSLTAQGWRPRVAHRDVETD